MQVLQEYAAYAPVRICVLIFAVLLLVETFSSKQGMYSALSDTLGR